MEQAALGYLWAAGLFPSPRSGFIYYQNLIFPIGHLRSIQGRAASDSGEISLRKCGRWIFPAGGGLPDPSWAGWPHCPGRARGQSCQLPFRFPSPIPQLIKGSAPTSPAGKLAARE